MPKNFLRGLRPRTPIHSHLRLDWNLHSKYCFPRFCDTYVSGTNWTVIQQIASVQCVEVLTQRSIKHEQDGFFGESCASAGNNLNLKCLHPWKATQLTVHNVMRCSGNLTCRRISQKSTHVNKFLQFQWCQTHRKVFLIILSKQKENSKNALIQSGFGWRMAKTYPTQRLLGFEEKM